MHYPINQYLPPLEQFCCWNGGFSQEECDKLVEVAELFEFRKGRVGNDQETLEVRDSDITWLHHDDQTHWIHDRIAGITAKINHEKFNLDLDGLDGLQYSKYALNQHYNWHTDGHGTNVINHRKLSMSLMLSHPEEYEGGELLLNSTGDADKCAALKLKRGDIVFFYSFVPHKVAPVTKGERLALVTWAMGPKYR